MIPADVACRSLVWVLVLPRVHGHDELNFAAPPRRATNPQTGGRRPKKRLLRQVSPPGARGTVASLLVHVPAALRECRAHGPHTDDVSEVVWGVPFWFGGLGILVPIYLLLVSFSSSPWFRPRRRISAFSWLSSRSRLAATREVVQLPQELFSITALDRHFKVPLCHCWRALRALWYGSSEGIFKGIWLASRKLFSPSRTQASLSRNS